LRKPTAKNLLCNAFTFLAAIDIRRVEEVNAVLQSPIHNAKAVSFASFRPEIHGTQAQTTDEQSRSPKMCVLHAVFPFFETRHISF
jgi:hypothetical protein